MARIVQHAVVLLITDDHDCGLETALALDSMGCLPHRVEPGALIDRALPYDAAVIITRKKHSRWCAGMLGRLRSSEFACGSLVLLPSGGPREVAEIFHRGAVDCLVRPVSASELLESISTVIDATKRWRARFSRARLLALSETRPEAATAAASEPDAEAEVVVSASAEIPDREKIEAIVDRVSTERDLTRRQRQVLYWLLHGHRYIDIASVLGITPRTAKHHAGKVLDKLELESRYDLARLLAEEFGPSGG